MNKPAGRRSTEVKSDSSLKPDSGFLLITEYFRLLFTERHDCIRKEQHTEERLIRQRPGKARQKYNDKEKYMNPDCVCRDVHTTRLQILI